MKTNKNLNRIETEHKHIYNCFNYSTHDEKSKCQAFVKLRLIHGINGSVIYPEYLFFENGSWIQPIQFLPPLLGKFDNSIECNIYADINAGETIKITVQNQDYLKEIEDRSQIFKCEVSCSADNILEYCCGEYTKENGKYYLQLFHHTDDSAEKKILASKELWSSLWNIRGNLKCKSHGFCYFSHLPKIVNDDDLTVIAMVNTEEIILAVDNFNKPKILMPDWEKTYNNFIYIPDVCRSSTEKRKETIPFKVPVELIDIKHLYMHTQGGITFYEVFHPFIHRIRTSKDETLGITDEFKIIPPENPQYPDYSIIGDARYKIGLAAPFEEESTACIFKIQACNNMNMLQFWFDNGNTDLFSKKDVTISEF